MSLRTQIAQMLVMGFSGTEISNDDKVVKWIKEDLGGVILFDKDLQHPNRPKNLIHVEQIKQLTTDFKKLSPQKDLPLLIALDYEGGEVDRLKDIPGCLSTIRPVEMEKLNKSARTDLFSSMANTLNHLGINLNFAPVVDLAFDGEDGIIGQRGRSFSSDAARVSELASEFVQVFKQSKVLTCYKHFPGHGSARGDTHLGFVDVTAHYESCELQPYYSIGNSVPMIMTAHVVNRHLDPSGLPATLSKPILTSLLRDELKYEGVIISDDLQMLAIAKHYPLKEALTLTINAGADMLIFGNQWGSHDASELIDLIESLVREGAISEERILDAYRRIGQMKTLLIETAPH